MTCSLEEQEKVRRSMKRLKVNLCLCLVAAALLALLLAPAVAQAAAWTVVQSPNATPGNNELQAVASVSANDVWAVGTSENTLGNDQTLILHWDGTAWSIVASPTTGMVEGNLLGVTAISTTDVWAVGSFLPTKGGGQALIEHWNGHKWSVVKNPSTGGTALQAVAAVSANDVWAVGNASNASGVSQTLIEHWDGKKWSIVASPSPSTQTNFLLGVTAVSTTDVWAVGSFRNASGAFQTLTLHWDGTTWSIVPSPSPNASSGGPGDDLLIGVDLKKDFNILHRAYNDSQGVTAQFNKHLLVRMNQELDANFQLNHFGHYAFYNPGQSRVEMHLVSLKNQTVRIGESEISFKLGESIWTESSYKYTLEEFAHLAATAGFAVERVWTDPRQLFSVQYLRVT
jgi:hypothetical protein